MNLNTDQIRAILTAHQPTLGPFVPEKTRAAVALILNEHQGQTRLCFIRRAEHVGDPWSGHMAFPGGRAEPGDASPRAVAERETEEEIGLRLPLGSLIAPLSEMPIRLGGFDTGMVLSPLVYHLPGEPPPFHLNGEVAAAYWIPLTQLWHPAQGTHLELERLGKRVIYPAIQFQETVIWGLTYRVLTLFSDVLEHPLPHLEEIPGLGR